MTDMSKQTAHKSTLYIVATPIGNLADISARAIEILRSVDVIICEDTRHSGKLLQNIGARAGQLIAYHDHSGDKTRQKILRLLAEGASAALISDAGTPLVSDPGYRLLTEAIEAGVPIVPIPGASAVLTALCASGLPTDKFSFIGFAPHKKREAFVESLEDWHGTVIFYESPERITDMVQRLAARTPERACVIARELTKIHEEILRGSVAECAEMLAARAKIKGEITVLLAPYEAREKPGDADIIALLADLLPHNSLRSAVDKVTAVAGENRRHVYRLALEVSKDGEQDS